MPGRRSPDIEKQQGDTASTQYQQVLQTTELQSPGTIFQPTGPLATQLGTNPIDQYYSQQNQQLSGPLYRKAITAYNASLTDYRERREVRAARKQAGREASYLNAAQLVGNRTAALTALQEYINLVPHSSNLKQVEAQCKLVRRLVRAEAQGEAQDEAQVARLPRGPRG